MELKLLLPVFMLLVQVSLALQRVSVRKGQTLFLRCPIRNAHQTTVEWRNPKGQIMFFNRKRALKDKRYTIDRLSASEFSVSVSNVTLKDGGNYTCSHYGSITKERKVEVTVLGSPIMKVAEHDGTHVIKCTAEGNHYPPQISWIVDQGPEILGHAQVHQEDTKYVSIDMFHIKTVERRVTVKCLIRHPALVSSTLMNFVRIRPNATKFQRTTLPTTRPLGSTEVIATATKEGGREAATTTDVNWTPSESSTSFSTVSTSDPQTVTASTSSHPRSPDTSTSTELGKTDWTSMTETTEEILPSNSTGGNMTGDMNDPWTHSGRKGSSSILVFLVTCLIACLLVVVLFFAIKLRREHIKWKIENEESDPSEDSNKSAKTSQDEKNGKGQRQRGLCNTAFTQYAIEKPTVMVVSDVSAVMVTESVENLQTFQPQPLAQDGIKETEL